MIRINASVKDIERVETTTDIASLVAYANEALGYHKEVVISRKLQLEYDDGKRPYSDTAKFSSWQYISGTLSIEYLAKQNINFANDINDLSTNFFVGHAPVIVQENANKKEQAGLNAFNRAMLSREWQTSFFQLVRSSVACGTSYYLTHVKEDKEFPRFSKLDSINTLVAYDNYIDPESLFGLYRSTIDKKNYVFTIYTPNYIYRLSSDKEDSINGVLMEEPTEHHFGRVPITEFINNEREVGDAYFVLGLIDLYCAVLNDGVTGFHEKMKNLLMLKNVQIGTSAEQDAFIEQIKDLGVLPIMGDNADAKFLESSFDMTSPKELLDRIHDLIYAQSHKIDVSSATFAQSLGEPALKLKLKPMLDDAQVKEKYYTPKLKRVFKCVRSYLEYLGKEDKYDFDIDKIDIVYSHPLPSNDQQAIMNLVNLNSANALNMKQALRQVSWIKDIESYIDGVVAKPVEQQLKELQGVNANNKALQDAKPLNENQDDNADNFAKKISNKQ
jgi:SPP1 family phage portal protein